MKIYFAADHAGFELKNILLNFVHDELSAQIGKKIEVEDIGAHEFDATDDYPMIVAVGARSLTQDLKEGRDAKAIILGGSGQGEAIVANRFEGVRAAVYYGGQPEIIRLSREHNDANVLSLGARFLSADDAKKAVRDWLMTDPSKDERHLRRIAEIETIAQV